MCFNDGSWTVIYSGAKCDTGGAFYNSTQSNLLVASISTIESNMSMSSNRIEQSMPRLCPPCRARALTACQLRVAVRNSSDESRRLLLAHSHQLHLLSSLASRLLSISHLIHFCSSTPRLVPYGVRTLQDFYKSYMYAQLLSCSQAFVVLSSSCAAIRRV